MKKSPLLLISFIFLLFSCAKSDHDQLEEKFSLKVAVIGGGCGFSKTLVLSEKTISKEEKSGNCGLVDSKQQRPMTSATFATLKTYLHDLDFKNLQRNDCFRCVDGIDVVIELSDNGQTYSNTIAYRLHNSKDLQEDKMQEFLQFLNEL